MVEACGFRLVGRRERLGGLRGRWRDVLLYERRRRADSDGGPPRSAATALRAAPRGAAWGRRRSPGWGWTWPGRSGTRARATTSSARGCSRTRATPPGTARAMSMEADLRAFRFSRMGPKGRQLRRPRRRLIGAGDDDDFDVRKLDSTIPAGFTYLGQFLDHDLTFDKSRAPATTPACRWPTSSRALAEPRPRLPLRPRAHPHARVLRGRQGAPEDRRDGEGRLPEDGIANKPQPGFDLPRRANRKARIPDVRNDENLAVAQTHLAFIRFHNRVVNKLEADGVPKPASRFATARETVVQPLPVDGAHRLPAARGRSRSSSTASSPRGARCSRRPPSRATRRRCRWSSRWPRSGWATA